MTAEDPRQTVYRAKRKAWTDPRRLDDKTPDAVQARLPTGSAGNEVIIRESVNND